MMLLTTNPIWDQNRDKIMAISFVERSRPRSEHIEFECNYLPIGQNDNLLILLEVLGF